MAAAGDVTEGVWLESEGFANSLPLLFRISFFHAFRMNCAVESVALGRPERVVSHCSATGRSLPPLLRCPVSWGSFLVARANSCIKSFLPREWLIASDLSLSGALETPASPTLASSADLSETLRFSVCDRRVSGTVLVEACFDVVFPMRAS